MKYIGITRNTRQERKEEGFTSGKMLAELQNVKDPTDLKEQYFWVCRTSMESGMITEGELEPAGSKSQPISALHSINWENAHIFM